MHRTLTLALVTILIGASLAGCTSRDEAEVADGDPSLARFVPEAGGPPPSLHPLSWPVPPAAHEEHIEGAFLVTETLPGVRARVLDTQAVDTNAAHVHDLSAFVPVDVPVRLEITLTVVGGKIEVLPSGASARHVAVDETEDGGIVRMTLTLLARADDAPALVVKPKGAAPATELSYVGQVRLEVEPDVLVEGAPVAFDVPAGVRSLHVSRASDQPATLLLWGADDAFLGRFELREAHARVDLPADAPAGEHVAHLVQGSASIFLPTNGATSVRALDLAQVAAGSPHEAVAGDAIWSFDTPMHPLRVGILLRSIQPETLAYADELYLRIRTEHGIAFVWDSAGHAFSEQELWGGWSTPGLAASTFEATVAKRAGTPMVVQALAEHWVR